MKFHPLYDIVNQMILVQKVFHKKFDGPIYENICLLVDRHTCKNLKFHENILAKYSVNERIETHFIYL